VNVVYIKVYTEYIGGTMNKSMLTVTTILALGSLGSVGCAGAAQYADTTPAARAVPAQVAGGDLGRLWESTDRETDGVLQRVAWEEERGDLWNSAPSVGVWEDGVAKPDPKPAFSATATELKF
jgi:hypothetical protein